MKSKIDMRQEMKKAMILDVFSVLHRMENISDLHKIKIVWRY